MCFHKSDGVSRRRLRRYSVCGLAGGNRPGRSSRGVTAVLLIGQRTGTSSALPSGVRGTCPFSTGSSSTAGRRIAENWTYGTPFRALGSESFLTWNGWERLRWLCRRCRMVRPLGESRWTVPRKRGGRSCGTTSRNGPTMMRPRRLGRHRPSPCFAGTMDSSQARSTTGTMVEHASPSL